MEAESLQSEPQAPRPPEPPPPPEPSFWSRIKPFFDGLGGEPTVIACGACAFLIISHYQGSAGFFRQLVGTALDQHPWNATFGHLWWFAASIVLYLVMPLTLALATRGSFNERYGFQLGDLRAGLLITALFLAVMLPATYVASTMSAFKGIYPLAGNSAFLENIGSGKTEKSWTLFLTYEAAYFSYFIAWEFLFRGWMIHGIAPKWGRGPAIMLQMAPFAVMHLGKAELEALGSIIAGVALGLLSLRTRSFYYGALIHGVVALWMDWLSVKGTMLGP